MNAEIDLNTVILAEDGDLQPQPKTWVVAGSASALTSLAPLIVAHEALHPVRVIELPENVSPTQIEWEPYLTNAMSLLWVGDRRYSPRTALPGLFLRNRQGKRIPVGWLPDCRDRLEKYAIAAAQVVARQTSPLSLRSIALLGSREDRVQQLVDQLQTELGDNPHLPIFRWTAERIVRRELLTALNCGLGAALYVGHGFPHGWDGYAGISYKDLSAIAGEPWGAVMSLTCSSASRHRVALSFAEELVLSGICGAALGATGQTKHRVNCQLAIRLCEVLQSGRVNTVAELLVAANLTRLSLQRYRLIGDPAMPLLGAIAATMQAQQVFAPAPNDPLPMLPLELWQTEMTATL